MRRFGRLIQAASRAGVLVATLSLVWPSCWVDGKPSILLNADRRSQLARRAEVEKPLEMTEEHQQFFDPPTHKWREIPKTRTRLNRRDKFSAKSGYRDTSGRGRQNHFHLLDRYIRRIDSLVPEDMEDLVRPLRWRPDLASTTRSINLNFPFAKGELENLTEDKIRAFCAPVEPAWIIWEKNNTWKERGEWTGTQVYLRFHSNEEAQEVWNNTAGHELCGQQAMVKYLWDDKFRFIAEIAGLWEEGFEPRRGPGGQILPPWSQSRDNPKNRPTHWARTGQQAEIAELINGDFFFTKPVEQDATGSDSDSAVSETAPLDVQSEDGINS